MEHDFPLDLELLARMTTRVPRRSEEYDAMLREDMDAAYMRFLQAKDEDRRMEGTQLAKRKRKEKVNLSYARLGFPCPSRAPRRALPPGTAIADAA